MPDRWRGYPLGGALLGNGTSASSSPGLRFPFWTGPEVVVAAVVDILAAEVGRIQTG